MLWAPGGEVLRERFGQCVCVCVWGWQLTSRCVHALGAGSLLCITALFQPTFFTQSPSHSSCFCPPFTSLLSINSEYRKAMPLTSRLCFSRYMRKYSHRPVLYSKLWSGFMSPEPKTYLTQTDWDKHKKHTRTHTPFACWLPLVAAIRLRRMLITVAWGLSCVSF